MVDQDLSKAKKTVMDAINKERARIKKIAETEEQDLILLEGETSTGYWCHLMVDPKEVAKILYEWDFAAWNFLDMDCPQEMWDELSKKYGITVGSVDI